MFQAKEFVCSAEQREKLILDHIGLIKFHASRLFIQLPTGQGFDQLLNAGVLGLMEAVTNYEPDAGLEFKTYADQLIQAAMTDRLGELKLGPYQISSGAGRLTKSQQAPGMEALADSKELELCHKLRINLDQLPLFVFNAHLTGLTIGSFSDVSGMADQVEAGKGPFRYHPDSHSQSSAVFDKAEIMKVLTAGVDDLPTKERLVLSLHYLEELTMKEIATTILRMAEWQVCQLHTKAVLRLRAKLRSHIDAHDSIQERR